MGLGDFLLTAGKRAVDSAKEEGKKIQYYYEKYEFEDTDTLIRMFKSHCGPTAQRTAVIRLLQERGVTRSDIEN